MSTFEESPLTGPLPPGSLPAPTPPTPLVPSQPVAPAAAPDPPTRSEPPAPLAEVDPTPSPARGYDFDGSDPDGPDPDALDEAELGPELLPATGRAKRIVAGLLAGTLLLGAVLAGALVYERRVQAQDQAVEAARSQAVAVVRLAAPLLLSYDYRTLAADFAAALAYTDGEFKKQYQQTTSTVVSPVAAQYKAVVRAQLVEVGVTSATADQVVLVAFVNQVTTSTRVTGTKLDQSRVRFELRRTGTAWKIVQVAAL